MQQHSLNCYNHKTLLYHQSFFCRFYFSYTYHTLSGITLWLLEAIKKVQFPVIPILAMRTDMITNCRH